MDTTPPPHLSIIIVTWNVRELLRANLTRLFSLPQNPTLDVFVVDNGSHDGTATMVREEFPRAHLITNDWDAGFAGPNNQALRMARGEVCVLLNPDMLVEPDSLAVVHRTLMRDRTIGVLGGKLLDEHGAPIVGSVRRYPDVWSQLAILLKIGHVFPRVLDRYLWRDFDFSRSQDVDQVRGSFFAFRRELLDTIGPLDAGYHLWFEEVDYCRRVRAAGLRVRYCAAAIARDYIGKGFAQMQHLEKQRIFTASMLRYFRKWHPPWQWLLLAAARPLALLAAASADVWAWVRTNVQHTECRMPPQSPAAMRHPSEHPTFDIGRSAVPTPTLALQLSCYNGSRYLPHLFASLGAQTFRDWHLHVLDNASRPEEAHAIRAAVDRARASGIPVTLTRVDPNIGFAGAQNLLFTKHRADLVQLLNDDAFLEPTYLAACVQYMTAHPTVAAVSGTILRWDFDRADAPNGGRTNIVDSLGLRVHAYGSVVDIDAGKPDVRGSQQPYAVFGVSGCLPMYRTAAVQAASDDGALFDRTYVSYKEDVDLAYRLQAVGMRAAVLPTAVAYHRRSLGAGVRRHLPPEVRMQSYRNHLWMLLTHLQTPTRFGAYICTIPYEVAKAVYWLFRDPRVVWTTIRDTRETWPHLMRKRTFVRMLRATRRPPPTHVHPTDIDLAIVMVSHNDLNAECLDSLEGARRAAPELRTAVIIVDNASTAYRANELGQAHIPDAIVLLRNGDYGFGRSCNRGADAVHARAYCFLNPDTVLTEPHILRTLHAYLTAHPGVGIVAPKIVYPDGRLQETCRRFPAWYMPFIQRTALRHTAFGRAYTDAFLMTDDDHAHERPVDWVQGSAIVIRGDLWHTLRGFDERYYMYFEDIDLCRRVWNAGYQVRYLPSVVLVHAHGRQSARIRNILVNIWKTKETRWHLGSWMKYQRKWFRTPTPTTLRDLGPLTT